jgi:hypothetical protein
VAGESFAVAAEAQHPLGWCGSGTTAHPRPPAPAARLQGPLSLHAPVTSTQTWALPTTVPDSRRLRAVAFALIGTRVRPPVVTFIAAVALRAVQAAGAASRSDDSSGAAPKQQALVVAHARDEASVKQALVGVELVVSAAMTKLVSAWSALVQTPCARAAAHNGVAPVAGRDVGASGGGGDGPGAQPGAEPQGRGLGMPGRSGAATAPASFTPAGSSAASITAAASRGIAPRRRAPGGSMAWSRGRRAWGARWGAWPAPRRLGWVARRVAGAAAGGVTPRRAHPHRPQPVSLCEREFCTALIPSPTQPTVARRRRRAGRAGAGPGLDGRHRKPRERLRSALDLWCGGDALRWPRSRARRLRSRCWAFPGRSSRPCGRFGK